MPLSENPEARAKQLANLRPPPPAPLGNGHALKHGGRALKDENLRDLPATRRVFYEWIADSVPIREGGAVPVADMVAVENAARTWARMRQLDDYVERVGPLDKRGRPRPALAALERTAKSLSEQLDKLGCSPTARAKLGLDVARTIDLAQALSEPDPARRRELLRLAGYDAGGEADG